MIEKLVDAGLVSSVADLYELTRDDFLSLDRVGEPLADKLMNSVEVSRGLGLRRALIGLSIPHVGEGTAKRLVHHSELMFTLKDETPEELEKIEDIGPETARSISSWFKDHSELVGRLMMHVNLTRLSEDAPVDTSSGSTFVVTGSIPGFKSRKDFVAQLESRGWVSQSSVSKSTEYLILEDPSSTSSKATKARSLGVEIIAPSKAAELAKL
jgi:DNA ligase (NAD+)